MIINKDSELEHSHAIWIKVLCRFGIAGLLYSILVVIGYLSSYIQFEILNIHNAIIIMSALINFTLVSYFDTYKANPIESATRE